MSVQAQEEPQQDLRSPKRPGPSKEWFSAMKNFFLWNN